MAEIATATRSYVDNFAMKEMVVETVAPKYFDFDINKLNVSLLGMMLEVMSDGTEDVFNSMTTLITETLPNRAQLDENKYSHAAIFQLSNSFATPSQCTFFLMIRKSDILTYGTSSNGVIHYFISKDTIINVEGIEYILDYDIDIRVQKYLGEYTYSAQYINLTEEENCISNISDPYIKLRNSLVDYIGMYIVAHQAKRTISYETIVNNSTLNFPVINVEYEGQLAGFDVFYKSPGSDNYVPLEKRLIYSSPLKEPFCYFQLMSDTKFKLSFTSKDSYFQPEFNSELKIVVYTTLGEDGNFEEYTGNDILVIPNGEVYDYNNSSNMAAVSAGSSIGGMNTLDIDELQALTVEAYRTAKAITTENDLNTYFQNFPIHFGGSNVKFVKRRNDVKERLYTAFLKMSDNGYIYPTNSLYGKLNTTQFDTIVDNSRFILKPGHLFRYSSGSNEEISLIDGMVYDKTYKYLIENDEGFIFTNPWIIAVNKKNLVGYYMSIVNNHYTLDFTNSNFSAPIQFIANSLHVNRRLGDTSYKISTALFPSATVDDNQVVSSFETNNNPLRVVAIFKNKEGENTCFIELLPEEDKTLGAGTFRYSINMESTDLITSNNLFKVEGVTSMIPSTDENYIPIENCVIELLFLYKSESFGGDNQLIEFDNSFEGYAVTNVYKTNDNPVTFIKPMNLFRSSVTYSRPDGLKPVGVDMLISLIPMVSAKMTLDNTRFDKFINSIFLQYENLNTVLTVLRNSSGLDIKFFNSYGKSKNFKIDDTNLIDKVNLLIKLKMKFIDGTDETETINNIKKHIKQYVEQINAEGGVNRFCISLLQKELQNKFAEIDYMIFNGINSYDTEKQTVIADNTTKNIEDMSAYEVNHYVPEFLTIDLDDILIQPITQ